MAHVTLEIPFLICLYSLHFHWILPVNEWWRYPKIRLKDVVTIFVYNSDVFSVHKLYLRKELLNEKIGNEAHFQSWWRSTTGVFINYRVMLALCRSYSTVRRLFKQSIMTLIIQMVTIAMYTSNSDYSLIRPNEVNELVISLHCFLK